MQPVKIGVQLLSLKLPLKKAIAAASQMGAKAVEIDARTQLKPSDLTQTATREIRKLLEDYGLKVSAIGFPTRRGYATPDDLEARVSGTKAALRMAYQLGASVVINDIGRVPQDQQSREWQTLIEVLTDLGNYSHQAGAWLAARTSSASGTDLKQLIHALPDGALSIDFDPAGLILHGHSPAETITELARHVVHIHARDAVGERGGGRGQEVTLGRGLADFPYLLAAMEDYQYRGFVTVERQNADDPLFEVEQGVKYLRNLTE